MGDVTQARAAACPRCGYDLRGVMGTWRTACPLSGTCAECGLDLDWARLLSPALDRPAWCVEYAAGWRSFPGRAARTLVRSYWPWGFWRALRMTDEIQWPRLAGYGGALAALLYLLFCAAQAVLAYGVVGGTTWTVFTTGGPTVGPVTVGWRQCVFAALAPLSARSIGGATESPADLFTSYWEVGLMQAAALCAVHWMCAAGFAALPYSLRTAKVRFAHIYRIAAYGMALLLPTIVLRLAGVALSHQRVTGVAGIGDMLNNAADWCHGAVIPAQIVWWSVATGCYLRIRHAWAVGASVVIMAWLAAAAALTWAGVLLA